MTRWPGMAFILTFLMGRGISALAGIESSGGTIQRPFVPAEPFAYECELTIFADLTGQPVWKSTTVAHLNNQRLYVRGDDKALRWTSYTRESGLPPHPFVLQTTSPPYDLAHFSLSLSFGNPRADHSVETRLAVSFDQKSGARSRSWTGTAIGNFSLPQLGAEAAGSHYDETSREYAAVHFTARCQRQRHLP